MSTNHVVDMAHISFLDMINVMLTLNTAANAKGTLMRIALDTADKIKDSSYETFEDYLRSIEDASNPIALVEGKAVQIEGYLFGLPKCPFAPSINNYKKIFVELPKGYEEFTVEFNKPSKVNNTYRIGENSGVSPFCAVHQPLRSAIGDKITIGGKKIAIYQLGCKASSGRKGYADKWITETGVSREAVEKTLDNNMCCYYLKIAE